MEEVLILRTVIDNRESIQGINQLKKANKEIKKALEESGDTGSKGFADISSVAEETGKTFDEVKDILRDTFKENEQEVRLFNRTLKESGELGSGSILELRESVKTLTREYDALDEETRDGAFGTELRDKIYEQVEALKELEGQTGRNQRNVGNYDEAVSKLGDKLQIMGVSLNDIKAAYAENTTLLKSLILGKEADAAATAAQTAATTAATTASIGFAGALRIVKLAIAATGIGLLLLLLGGLVAGFASTQEGADTFARALEPIKFVIQRIIGIFQELSFILIDKVKAGFEQIKSLSIGDIFTSIGDAIKNNLLNRVEAFGVAGKAIARILSGDLKEGFIDLGDAVIQFGTGIEDASEKIGNAIEGTGDAFNYLKDELAQAAADGKKYIETKIALEKEEIKLQTALEQSKLAYANLREEINNQQLSDIERIKASKAASAELQRAADLEKSLIYKRIQLAELENAQNDTDREAQLELAKLKAQLIQLDTEAGLKRARLISQETGLINKLVNSEKARIQQIEELNDTNIQSLEREKNKLLESLGLREQDLESIKQNQADILEVYQGTEEGKAELQKIFEDSYIQRNEAILKIEKDFNEKLADIAKEQIDQALKAQEAGNNLDLLKLEEGYFKKVLAANGNKAELLKIEEEYNREKLAKIRELIENEIQIISSELDQLTASNEGGIAESILTEEQKNELKLRLQELQTELAKTNAEYAKVGNTDENGEPARSLADRLGISDEQAETLRAGYETAMQGIQSVLASASQAIETRTQQRIQNIDDALERGTISEEEAEREKDKIRRDAFEKQKKVQIATATVSYIQGLISAISNAMQYPFPASLIIGALQTAVLTTAFGVNIKKIKSTQFEKGGVLKGKSHREGGIKTEDGQYEFEGDEGIINKKSMSDPKLRALASYANEKRGGTKFGGGIPAKLREALDEYTGISGGSIMRAAGGVRKFYASGGAVPSFSPLAFSSEESRSIGGSTNDKLDTLINAVATPRQSYVSVTEINEGQGDVEVIEIKEQN